MTGIDLTRLASLLARLGDGELEELLSGGECHLHFHPVVTAHEDIEKLNAATRVVQTNANFDWTTEETVDVVVVDTSAASRTVTLPHAVGGRVCTVTKAHTAFSVVVQFQTGETLFGATSTTLVSLGEVKRFKAYNGNWILI